MSKRDRRQQTGARGIAVFSGICFVITLLAWAYYSNIHRYERSGAAHNHYRNSHVPCEPFTIATAVDCLLEQDATDYEKTSEYYDLKAQQDMAKWALLMLLVTSFGVVYIALTLHASRETLREAGEATEAAKATTLATQEIGYKQLRARLSVTDFTVTGKIENYFEKNAFIRDMNFTAQIFNSGGMPARKVEAKLAVYFMFKGNRGHAPEKKEKTFFDIPNGQTVNIIEHAMLFDPHPLEVGHGDRLSIVLDVFYDPSAREVRDGKLVALNEDGVAFVCAFDWDATARKFIRDGATMHYKKYDG